MFFNCAGEDSLESLGQQGDETSLFQRKSTLNIYWRTDAESDDEVPILWLSDVKSWFTGKDPDAGKDWGQDEKGVTEDEMVIADSMDMSEQTQRDAEGQDMPQSVGLQTVRRDWVNSHMTLQQKHCFMCEGRAQVERALLMGS